MKSLKTAFQHIRRSPYQAMGAISVITLTFLISLVFIMISSGSQVILNWFETRPQVSAYFKDGTTLPQIETLKIKITQTGKAREITYVSKEQALSIYKEMTKGEPLLQEAVTANVLPASLEIATTELKGLKEVADILKKEEIVETVIFPEDVISSLSTWTGAIRKVGAGLIGFMSIISLLVIIVIIGMKIAIKREEIEILKLIGATSGQVRMPFILEGAIYGSVGAVIAWTLTYIALLYSTPFLVTFLVGIPLFPIPILIMLVFLAGSVVAGIIIGVLGSFIAVSRFLK